MRASVSIPSSSPTPSPVLEVKLHVGKKRSRTKLNMAGLVGGDSDSSALTQESGDEGIVGTPRGSVITGTDGGTDHADDEDIEMRELSHGMFSYSIVSMAFGSSPIAPSASPKPTRGRQRTTKKGGRGRGGAASGVTRPKKRKRGG